MKRLLTTLLAILPLLCCSCASEDKGTGKEKPPQPAAPGGPNPVVEIKTSMGTIKVELFADKSPLTVANFLRYVDEKHYDGTIFHRVIKDFMIQGGGFKPALTGATSPAQMKANEKPTHDPVANEALRNGLSNKRGTLAMARTQDPDSATSQFFINVGDNDGSVKYNLNPQPGSVGYCVFGKVIEGMDVVDEVRAVPTKQLFRGVTDVPVKTVLIESIRRVQK